MVPQNLPEEAEDEKGTSHLKAIVIGSKNG